MAKRKSYLEIKVRPKTKAEKERYERAAESARQSLSKWMLAAAEAKLASA